MNYLKRVRDAQKAGAAAEKLACLSGMERVIFIVATQRDEFVDWMLLHGHAHPIRYGVYLEHIGYALHLQAESSDDAAQVAYTRAAVSALGIPCRLTRSIV